MPRVPPSEVFYREHTDTSPERITPGDAAPIAEAEHLARYRFASKYVHGKRVLDAGCGVGYGAAFLADAGALDVLALDRSEEALKWARSHYDRPHVRFRHATFPPLPLPDAAVEVVCALEIIEHLDDDAMFAAECARVLVPRGLAIISTPNKAITSPGWQSARNRHHVREYHEEDLRDMLAQHFTTVTLFGQFRAPRLDRYYAADAILHRVATGPLRIVKALIPRPLRRAVRSRLRSAAAGGVDHNATAADFVIEEGRTGEALVFLALCRK